MKVLLRENGQPFQWVEATWDGDFHFQNGNHIKESNIVSIEEDNRKNLIRCSVCGQVFKKNSKAFNNHQHASSTSESCLTCPNLHQEKVNNMKCNFTLQEDGTYVRTTKDQVVLKCHQSWRYSYDINSEEARQNCAYRRCANATAKPIEDFFTKNPGAFDDLITIDRILESGAKYENTYAGKEYYKLKTKNKIEAIINSLNIVEKFRIYYKVDYWDVVYSKKYNKLYFCGTYKYEEWQKPWEMSTESYEYIKKKIAELY